MTTSSFLQRSAILLLATVLALGTACGDDDDDEETQSAGQQASTSAAAAVTTTLATTTTNALATTTTAAGNRITISNFAFSGLQDARAGSSWTVANADTVPHTVSADDGSFKFDVAGGETKSFTKALAPGSYPVHCDIHPSRMTGTLVVR